MPRILTEDDLSQSLDSLTDDDGPFGPVKVHGALFRYRSVVQDPAKPDGTIFKRNTAQRGDTITVPLASDFAAGVRGGVFLHPEQEEEGGEVTSETLASASPELVEFVDTHNVDEVLERAGDDAVLAADLLEAERANAQAKGKDPRKGVVAGLQAVIDADEENDGGGTDEGTTGTGEPAAGATGGTTTEGGEGTNSPVG